MNASWHARHPLGSRPTRERRLAWHRLHQEHCACRPVPASLKDELDAPVRDPRLASLIAAFSRDPRVQYGGKGFGRSALRVDGKIFAMVTSRGEFVVKLPRTRVAALVESGKGRPFGAGKPVRMKEWLIFEGTPARRLALAREALAYLGGGGGSGTS